MNALCIDKIKAQFDKSFALYQSLLVSGVAREQARIVLPQSMYTTFWMTGNLHNWIKFLRLRNSEHAQAEVKHLALAIQEILWNLYPATFGALEGDSLAELKSDES
jgi:thymidylate synthase (FAD)